MVSARSVSAQHWPALTLWSVLLLSMSNTGQWLFMVSMEYGSVMDTGQLGQSKLCQSQTLVSCYTTVSVYFRDKPLPVQDQPISNIGQRLFRVSREPGSMTDSGSAGMLWSAKAVSHRHWSAVTLWSM